MAVKPEVTTGQYLTFKLADEVFATEIENVREVLEFTSITKVPQTPKMMIGVINLRSKVVPVIDLRLKFGMEKGNKTVDTCIIIIEIRIDDDLTVIGALVDSVSEVMDQNSADIQPPPKIGTQLNTEYIEGMGKQGDHFVIILNVERIFSMEELSAVQGVAETQAEETVA